MHLLNIVPGSTVALAAALGFALACTAKRPTEVVAGVSTQIQVPKYLKAVGIVVQMGQRTEFCSQYPVADGSVTLPATLGVLGGGASGSVTVQVLGFRTEQSSFDLDCVFTTADADDAEVMVVRRRRLTFIDDKILFLPLPLKESCSDKDCGDDETCVGGACVPIDLDASTLVTYADSLIFGDTNTCFDPARCLPGGATVPVLLENPADCSFRAQWPESAPMPADGELNVRVYYNSFGSEILDLDREGADEREQEGFAFADRTKPLEFRLSPNLCATNYKDDKILGLEASALCPPKRALQPLCDSYTPPNPRADGSGGGASAPGLCTIAGLRPVESAVYVLMDRAQTMFKYFGNGAFRFAIELPLSNPVAKRTRVAFGFLPPTAAQCGTFDYETPEVPFGNVDDVRQPIGDTIGSSGAVFADSPALYLDAAMQGAYRALENVSTDQASGFNRRALVVISNRDMLADRCAGQTALERATAAFAQTNKVFTYTVALEDDAASPLESAAVVDSATQIATAGGTEVFNGVADEEQGLRAVQDILTDLGSCLYEVVPNNANPIESALGLPQGATVSYLHPLTRRQVDIPQNDACSDGASASGWNADGNLVRICGQACDDLREVISNLAIVHAQSQHPSPPLPLVVTATCE
jgi:hypothetical protein